MTLVIAEPRVEEYPADCACEGQRMLCVHPGECADCGACEPVCPVEAIYYEDGLPYSWRVHAGRPDSGAAGRRGQRVGFAEDTMKVIVYGDFNCPYSYLASQRAGRLIRGGAARVDWRAVEHDCGLARTGTSSDADRWAWDRELAEVAALALPGEGVPAAPPPRVSNTRAAVAAYAEAVSDGIADELRRLLFAAIWVEGRHISSADEVRRLVTGLMWQAGELACRLASPDIPGLLDRDPDPARIVRRSGGTIAPGGGPLTTVGWRRIPTWRQDWLAFPSQVIPAVIGPDQILRSGTEGLRYLAGLAGAMSVPARLPGRAEPGTGRQPRAAAARAA